MDTSRTSRPQYHGTESQSARWNSASLLQRRRGILGFELSKRKKDIPDLRNVSITWPKLRLEWLQQCCYNYGLSAQSLSCLLLQNVKNWERWRIHDHKATQERWRITIIGTGSSSHTRERHRNKKRNLWQNAEEKKNDKKRWHERRVVKPGAE